MFKSKTKQVANLFLADAKGIREEAWNLGGEKEIVEPDGSRLAAMADECRVLVTAGNLAVINGLHNGTFAHVSRKQYLHRALVAHGAYGFAADACAYSWGTAIKYFCSERALRVRYFPQTGADDV